MEITDAATETTSSTESLDASTDSTSGTESLDASPDATGTPIDPRTERRRLEEQLSALKRREAELRRALAIADHPELADAVRALDGATYTVTRVEAKMAQGLSKSEEKRKETVEKKLAQAEEKRAELDTQIAEFRAELNALGEERVKTFEAERREGLMGLIACLNDHHGTFEAASVDPSSLVPEIARLMPEVSALAEALVQARDARTSN